MAKGYEVHGLIRRASALNTHRIDDIYQDPHDQECRLFLHYGDLTEGTSLLKVLMKAEPDEVYNLAAQSHVMVSFEQPEYTANVVALGALSPDSHFSFDSANHRVASDAFIYAGWKALKALRRSTPNG